MVSSGRTTKQSISASNAESPIFQAKPSTHAFLFALSVLAGIISLAGCNKAETYEPIEVIDVKGIGSIETVNENVKLDWSHELDAADEVAGWTSRLGPSQNGIVPNDNMEIDLSWDGGKPVQLWSREIELGYSTPVISSKGQLILLQRRKNQELVECLSAATGESIWEYCYPVDYVSDYEKYTDGPKSTPIIVGKRVMTLGVDGRVHCLNIDTGELFWHRDLRDDFTLPSLPFGVGVSPVAVGDQVIIQLGAVEDQAGVVALNLEDGTTNWTATDHPASYATPCYARVAGVSHLLCLTDRGLVSIDPVQGDVRWEIPFRGKVIDSQNACPPILVDDMVLVSAYGMGCLSIRLKQDGRYEELWRDHRRPVLDCHYNNVIGLNGHVYGFSAIDRTFRCVNAKTGELVTKWRSEMRRGYSLKVNDAFILFGEHGYLSALQLDDGKFDPIARSSEPLVEYPCYAAPAFFNGCIYVKNEKTLCCYQLSIDTELVTQAESANENVD